MRVLVAMSGGVDSSVAAALLVDAGHDVVGATLKLWGGASDSGCCAVSDTDDARRVARHLGIEHHIFNFAADFERLVVEPYVQAHATGRTPNPCIACNRHLKFDRFVQRAAALGFDAIATGHHARVVVGADGSRRVARGADAAKDQSYVLHMLAADQLARLLLPVGDRTKAEVRALAAGLGLPTAHKPDSQDVCFVTRTGGRRAFLGDRIALRPAELVDPAGAVVGRVDAAELVTVGQRRGLGLAGDGAPRYALSVDPPAGVVRVGTLDDLEVDRIEVADVHWVGEPPAPGVEVTVQTSAHGAPVPATVEVVAPGRAVAHLRRPTRRVAPGQSVVVYRGEVVDGGGEAT